MPKPAHLRAVAGRPKGFDLFLHYIHPTQPGKSRRKITQKRQKDEFGPIKNWQNLYFNGLNKTAPKRTATSHINYVHIVQQLQRIKEK